MRFTRFFAAALIMAATLTTANAQTSVDSAATANTHKLMIDSTATGPVATITTTLGDVKIRLYDDTPLHRDNFIKLATDGTYDGVLFHRVIKDFMVQTGDINSNKPDNTQPLGTGDTNYTIEAEIMYPKHFHKYGAVAAARTGDHVNPERRSSGSQFYIVTGKSYPEAMMEQIGARLLDQQRQTYFRNLVLKNRERITELEKAQEKEALKELHSQLVKETTDSVPEGPMPAEVYQAYTTIGGTPHLDSQYTVFGEVIDGMDVIEKIQSVETDDSDRPKTDIRIISIKIEK